MFAHKVSVSIIISVMTSLASASCRDKQKTPTEAPHRKIQPSMSVVKGRLAYELLPESFKPSLDKPSRALIAFYWSAENPDAPTVQEISVGEGGHFELEVRRFDKGAEDILGPAFSEGGFSRPISEDILKKKTGAAAAAVKSMSDEKIEELIKPIVDAAKTDSGTRLSLASILRSDITRDTSSGSVNGSDKTGFAIHLSEKRIAEARSLLFIGAPAGQERLRIINLAHSKEAIIDLGDVRLSNTGPEGVAELKATQSASAFMDMPPVAISEMGSISISARGLANSWTSPAKPNVDLIPWHLFVDSSLVLTDSSASVPRRLSYLGGGVFARVNSKFLPLDEVCPAANDDIDAAPPPPGRVVQISPPGSGVDGETLSGRFSSHFEIYKRSSAFDAPSCSAEDSDSRRMFAWFGSAGETVYSVDTGYRFTERAPADEVGLNVAEARAASVAPAYGLPYRGNGNVHVFIPSIEMYPAQDMEDDKLDKVVVRLHRLDESSGAYVPVSDLRALTSIANNIALELRTPYSSRGPASVRLRFSRSASEEAGSLIEAGGAFIATMPKGSSLSAGCVIDHECISSVTFEYNISKTLYKFQVGGDMGWD